MEVLQWVCRTQGANGTFQKSHCSRYCLFSGSNLSLLNYNRPLSFHCCFSFISSYFCNRKMEVLYWKRRMLLLPTSRLIWLVEVKIPFKGNLIFFNKLFVLHFGVHHLTLLLSCFCMHLFQYQLFPGTPLTLLSLFYLFCTIGCILPLLSKNELLLSSEFYGTDSCRKHIGGLNKLYVSLHHQIKFDFCSGLWK